VRVAALYDIHGNLPALEAVVAELDQVRPDAVVIGGDAVGGPSPAESLAIVSGLGLPTLYVRGNGERAPDPFEAERLSDQQLATIAAWPLTVSVPIDGLGDVLFCHATPRSDEELITAITPAAEIAPGLAGVSEQVIVCGHVHVRFDRSVAGHRVVNPGSVGMPYEGVTGVAFWGVFGPDVELRQTRYARDQFDRALADSGYPHPDYYDQASADEVTAHFEQLRTAQ
jgi:predicted phosphodiesterase